MKVNITNRVHDMIFTIDNFDEEFSVRLHRGLSWLQRAELENNDPDASFIFLWISFLSLIILINN